MNFEASLFLEEIQAKNLGLTPEQEGRAAQFASILHRENEIQNLTRILGEKEFVSGHLLDVIELLKSPVLGSRVLDVGSGCGVPGLLAAAIDGSDSRLWFLSESEGKKAEYLIAATKELELRRVAVLNKRAEQVISTLKPDTVIARAVGSVEKIASWIWDCSTWNNLVLFKSKGWEEEWKTAQLTRFGKKLTVTHIHEYSSEDKFRILVTLSRAKFG